MRATFLTLIVFGLIVLAAVAPNLEFFNPSEEITFTVSHVNSETQRNGDYQHTTYILYTDAGVAYQVDHKLSSLIHGKTYKGRVHRKEFALDYLKSAELYVADN